MLAYIYRIAREFERNHGMAPNLLYLNQEHSHYLQQTFADGTSLSQIMDCLHMELIVDQECVHPHVAWTHTAQRLAG